MNLKYDVPTPPEGAKERAVELGKMRMRTLRLSKMPLGRLIALQLGNFSPTYWLFQLLTIIAILCADGIIVSEASAARLLIFVYAGAASTLACPELVRDMSCKMSEIELSCRVSGADLIAARMLIIGTANLIGLVLTAVIAAAKYCADLAVLLASGAALMFTSSLLTLLALRALPMIKSRAGALSLSLISAVAVETVCAGIPWSAGFWFIFAGISFGLLALEVWRELRCMEHRKGKSIWNYL